MTSFSQGVLNNLFEKAKEMETVVEQMDENTDWINLLN